MNDPDEKKTQDEDRGQVIERPDGFYWRDKSSGKEYGPFPSLLAATQDMQSGEEDEFEEGESREEAEAEIGITDWIDPDTGIPTEDTTSRFRDE